ncbi:MAG: hypothetical protein CAPSK01_002939 [Candidatus Accumulibacter vicinus]|uniref:Transposase n=1 Tax=Candidatus Accumulibacter vicinus TaxID=2954382 RepID=A0A084XYF4_9PROT|nr:MAG: hypothetical protein CAPSK01_002939 [Candidatus Accumulibacter vicinus]
MALAEQHDIHPNQITDWKLQRLDFLSFDAEFEHVDKQAELLSAD